MSLINDALRDLDSRERLPQTDSHQSASDTVTPQAKKSTKPLLFAAVIFAAGFGAYKGVSVMQLDAAGSDTERHALAEEKSTFVSAEIPVTGSAENTNTPQALSSLQQVTVEKATISERAEQLLVKAETAITRNRLSLPAQGNALYFLDQINVLFPHHGKIQERAASMRAEVLARYRAQLDKALADMNHARVAFLLSRSEKFGLSSAQKRHFEQSLAEIQPELAAPQQQRASVAPGEPGEAQADSLTAVSSSSNHQQDSQKKKKETWVKLTSRSQELAVISRAQAHLTRGAQQAAERVLSDYLVDNLASIEARSFLFDHYMTARRLDQAQLLLSTLPQGHALGGYFNAQIANAVHGPEQAIAILESSEPDARVATQYRTLLAGLYQKTSRHEKAFSLYRSLLKEDENNLVALLGFALAADHLGDAPASLAAYRRIMHLGHPNERVQRYVEKRINTLQNNDLAEATPW